MALFYQRIAARLHDGTRLIRNLDRPEHGQRGPGDDAQARDAREQIRDIAGLEIPLVEQVDEVETSG